MEGRPTDDLMARLMATFGAEAEERVEAMNRALMRVRGAAGDIEGLLEPLLREAHSLKGAAHAVGVDQVEVVAARLEDVLNRLRKGDLTPDAAVWDVVRRGVDAARALAREATAGEPAGVDTAAIEAMLVDPARAATAPAPARDAPETGGAVEAKLQALRFAIDDLAARLEALRDLADEVGDLLAASQQSGERSGRDGLDRLSVVLLVEDSQTTRVLQKHLLERAGYGVHTAGDGTEAWNALQSGEVDVVVSDIVMSDTDGFELTARIRADAALRTLPVILITATDSPERRERSAEVGADAYVVKGSPDHRDLAATIERVRLKAQDAP